MKVEKKIICGKNCNVTVVNDRFLRLVTNAAYCVSPFIKKMLHDNKDASCKQISANTYVLTDNVYGQSLLLTCCEDGSCMMETEVLVPVTISDEEAEAMLEEIMNTLEEIFPELKGQASSSSGHLGSSAKDAKDFLLNREVANILRLCGDGLRTAKFTYSGSDDSNEDLRDQNGEVVEIIRQLTPDEADLYDVGPMYKVKFRCGLVADVFGDELTLTRENHSVSSVVEQGGLKNILGVLMAHPEELDGEGLAAQRLLEQIYLRDHNSASSIVDLASYESDILWSGADDVRYILEGGEYEEDLKSLGLMDEYNQEGKTFSSEFIDEVTSDVDWDDVATAGIEAGNELIAQSIDACLRVYREKREQNATINISQEKYEELQGYLKGKAFLGVDESVVITAVFEDGLEADISVSGPQQRGESAWAEAILFEHGNEVACDGPYFDALPLEWHIRKGEKTYNVVIHVNKNN